MPENDLLTPPGTRLLHIGPPKTGTTAIQGALTQARSAMPAHGVVYPGKARQHTRAARAVLGVSGPRGDPPVDPRGWDRLVREVGFARDRRVVISSEVFSGADKASIVKIVSALGGPRVHVVVTVRPLVQLLPSAWHEGVRQGQPRSYEKWLSNRLQNPPPEQRADGFWHKQLHGFLVERWASVVGAGNVTVIVPDDSDRLMLMRVFEQLVGLPPGLLTPGERTNPSLGFGDIELVRHLNREFLQRGWPFERHRRLVRKGMTRYLQAVDRPTLDGQRIRTPPWAVECATEIGARQAQKIAATGVRVVGDLDVLGALPDGYENVAEPLPLVHPRTAAHAVIGTILAAVEKRRP